MSKSFAYMLFGIAALVWFFPGFNGILFEPSNVNVGEGHILSAVIFVAGLVVLLSANLKEADFQKRSREENEKREAAKHASRAAEAEAMERSRKWSWEQKNREREWEREREESQRAELVAIQAEENRLRVVHYDRTTHLKRCRDQCRSAQDAEGLLPIEVVSRIFGWGAFEDYEGKIVYPLGEIRGVFSGDDCYAVADEKHPFPKEIRTGFFRASDVINWLDEEYRGVQSKFDQLAEDLRLRRVRITGPPQAD